MTGRIALICAAFVLALAGVASAAVLALDADRITVLRIPGTVPVKTCTISAVSDAYVDEALPDAAAGTAPALEVTAGPADRRAFVRFDVAGCSIPAGAEVRSAALAMVLAAAPAEARNWKVQRVTDAWAGDVTWSTAPAVAAASTDTAATGIAAGATLQWNVLPDVADVVSGAALDRGWRIADADETPVAPVGGALASSEAAAAGTRPTLTVTWFD